MSTQTGVILTDLLLLLDQSPLLLQDSGILLICRILHNDSSSYRARTVVPLRDISCGSYHNHIYHIYLRLASLRFLLFTFNSWTHLFWTFLLFYGIHCWVHPSIFFSGCLNSFRGLDQFQLLFQASILRPNRDTFRELLCTCSGKRINTTENKLDLECILQTGWTLFCISPQSPQSENHIRHPIFFPRIC